MLKFIRYIKVNFGICLYRLRIVIKYTYGLVMHCYCTYLISYSYLNILTLLLFLVSNLHHTKFHISY